MTAKLLPGRMEVADHVTVDRIDELCRLVLEVQLAAESDLCGEQRDYHLPRLRRIKAILMKTFPINFLNAIEKPGLNPCGAT